ncbi:MAG: hypothetical protein ABI743_07455, partial [bacterium]
MRLVTLSASAALLLIGAGCAGSDSGPLAPSAIRGTGHAPGTVALGPVALQGDLVQSALGVYDLALDPVLVTATASLAETRQATQNDDLYLLPIDRFLRSDSFRVISFTETATTLDLTWRFTHPFKAPVSPVGTPNGSNRADLGVAGLMVLATDVLSATGHTYFDESGTGGGRVIAETDLAVNPDLYYQPGGLVTTTTLTNTYPAQVLVDESGSGGSRVSMPNGGDPTGNFGADGWTRDEFGPNNDGWTGFGVIHQGQASQRTLSLDKATLLAQGTTNFDVLIIAKYNDPRGGANGAERRSNRLPPATPDFTKFAYRMPHGALDAQRLIFEGASGP